MIDLKREPIEHFVDLHKSKNTQLSAITSDDIAIRRLNLFTPDRWPKPKAKSTIHVDPYGSKLYVTPAIGWPKDNAAFLLHKRITFKGGDVSIAVRADNNFKVYIDRQLVAEGADYLNTITTTVNVEAGEHEVIIWAWNGTGGAGLAAVLNDAGTHHSVDDVNWTCVDIGSDTVDHWLQPNGESTVEVDLLVEPSEAIGDYAKFNYERITMPSLFSGMDMDVGTEGIQIPYHIDDIDMLLGSVDNFKSIFNTWYRFSHNASYTYPANASELNGWKYIEEYDCIESTINSGTYVGFISDDLVGDYEFNTVITSANSDDDTISIILAAFKQGDIDEHEHTLELVMTRGGLNGSYVRINSNYAHMNPAVVRILDPDTTAPNSGNPWTPWYGHIVGKRIGDKIYVWCKQAQLPAVESGQTRDDMIKGLVGDLARWDETDFTANSYLTAIIDLSVEQTKFNRTVRYGYGQQSQAASRFWNIRRPGDNPDVTPKLKTYMIDRYGFNAGSDGLTIANMGANVFKMSLDNVLYIGDLELSPTNRRYMLGAERLINEGRRFSHNATGVYPAVPEELNNWVLDGSKVKFTGGGSFSGVVTPYKATEYEFHTDVSSTGTQHYPVSIVVAFVEVDGVEHTLSVLCDVPETEGNGEWQIRRNTLQADTEIIASNPNAVAYTWADISARNVYVKREGNIIEISCNNKSSEPGNDWTYTLDLTSDAKYAPFLQETHFGYGCYTQSPSWFRDKIV